MKYPYQCEIDQIIDNSSSRFAIHAACLRGNGLWATNGKALVCVPVERDEHDQDGLIPVEALKFARSRSGKKCEVEVQSRARAIKIKTPTSAMIIRRDIKDIAFPKIEAVVPPDEEYETSVYLDGPLLIDLLRALGAHRKNSDGHNGVTIKIHKDGGEKPVKIEAHTDESRLEKHRQPFAVIMPMKVKD